MAIETVKKQPSVGEVTVSSISSWNCTMYLIRIWVGLRLWKKIHEILCYYNRRAA